MRVLAAGYGRAWVEGETHEYYLAVGNGELQVPRVEGEGVVG